jgi:pimeloyl-ACP methyl ester carboxylesterase
MPYVEVAGARLSYADSGGDSAPLIFVHPAAATSAGWVHQVQAFTAVGYRCITFDLRGFGQSSVADPAAASQGAISDDLAALADALDLPAFGLVAAAYGGFGAVDFALRFPARVRAFVLSTSQGGIADPIYTEVLRRAVPPEIRALPVHLRELGPSYRAEDPDGVARWQAIEAEAHARTTRQAPHLQVTLPMLAGVTAPTLLVAAGADLLAPPALMRLIAARIPHARMVVIGEAGHSAHWERPAEWNQLVIEFLAQVLPLATA